MKYIQTATRGDRSLSERQNEFSAWLNEKYTFEDGYYYKRNEFKRPCYDSRDKTDMNQLLQLFNQELKA